MSVYFVRFGDHYKIGFSDNLCARIAAIIGALPPGAEFVGHMPGDRDVEQHLHRRFASGWKHSEWFSASENLKSFIRIALDPDLPKPETAPLSAFQQDASSAWTEVSDRMRSAAAHRWPQLNHSQRKAVLAEVLGWTPRRVRSLYDNDPHLVLRQVEMEALEELIFPFDADAEAMSSLPLSKEDRG